MFTIFPTSSVKRVNKHFSIYLLLLLLLTFDLFSSAVLVSFSQFVFNEYHCAPYWTQLFFFSVFFLVIFSSQLAHFGSDSIGGRYICLYISRYVLWILVTVVLCVSVGVLRACVLQYFHVERKCVFICMYVDIFVYK